LKARIAADATQAARRFRMKQTLKFHQALSFTWHAAVIRYSRRILKRQQFAHPAVSLPDKNIKK
jgi:hypothetical protein